MSTGTKIQWTDTTWNPLRGCSAISPGCAHCYAARMCSRGLPGLLSPTTREPFAIHGKWTGRVELIESKLTEPLRWRKPRRVFVNSMSDLFHDSVSDDVIDRVFAVMALAPQHTFQVLTKRAGRLPAWCRRLQRMADEWAPRTAKKSFGPSDVLNLRWLHWTVGMGPAFPYHPWPIPNVWIGVSVEDRARLSRIDELRATPAAVRFISFEPLLEDVGRVDLTGIHWVICGCESGPGARPFDEDWARGLRDQCQAAGVAFFYKQAMRNGKLVALPELDGRQWAEFPKGGAA